MSKKGNEDFPKGNTTFPDFANENATCKQTIGG